MRLTQTTQSTWRKCDGDCGSEVAAASLWRWWRRRAASDGCSSDVLMVDGGSGGAGGGGRSGCSSGGFGGNGVQRGCSVLPSLALWNPRPHNYL